jgi:methyl-accepting chemotaxis protein
MLHNKGYGMRQNIVSNAMTGYLMWKFRFRDFLEGKGDIAEAEVVSHRDCDLGVWLYSEGLAGFGTLPEMHDLERAHAELHMTAKKVFDLKKAGKDLAARQEFLKLEESCMKVFSLLTELAAKIH